MWRTTLSTVAGSGQGTIGGSVACPGSLCLRGLPGDGRSPFHLLLDLESMTVLWT